MNQKIFKDDQDLVSIKIAFQNVINTVDKLKNTLIRKRKTLRNNDSTQEQFAECTHQLKTIVAITRTIEDELFEYDLELEEGDDD